MIRSLIVTVIYFVMENLLNCKFWTTLYLDILQTFEINVNLGKTNNIGILELNLFDFMSHLFILLICLFDHSFNNCINGLSNDVLRALCGEAFCGGILGGGIEWGKLVGASCGGTCRHSEQENWEVGI